MIFRRVFFPASTVPKMYWGGRTTHSTTEFQERRTIPPPGCKLASGVTFPWGNQEMPGVAVPLVEHGWLVSVLSHKRSETSPSPLIHRWEPQNSPQTQAAHSRALKHTLNICPLRTFCNLTTIRNIRLGSWRPSFTSHMSSPDLLRHMFLHLQV